MRDRLFPFVVLVGWFLVSSYTVNALRYIQVLQIPTIEAPAVVITQSPLSAEAAPY